MIDDCNINNLAKNQVSAVFHSHAIRRSVLPKFRELCMESPCFSPSEGLEIEPNMTSEWPIPIFSISLLTGVVG